MKPCGSKFAITALLVSGLAVPSQSALQLSEVLPEKDRVAACFNNFSDGPQTSPEEMTKRVTDCVLPVRDMMKEVFNAYADQIVPQTYDLSPFDQIKLGLFVGAAEQSIQRSCIDVISQKKSIPLQQQLPRTFKEAIGCLYVTDDIHTREVETVKRLRDGSNIYLSGQNLGYQFDAARAGLVVMAAACGTVQIYPQARIYDREEWRRDQMRVILTPADDERSRGAEIAEFCPADKRFNPERLRPSK